MGVGACLEAAAHGLDWSPGVQEAGAPCREVPEGAWASEAYLREANRQQGRNVNLFHLKPVCHSKRHEKRNPLEITPSDFITIDEFVYNIVECSEKISLFTTDKDFQRDRQRGGEIGRDKDGGSD